MNKKVYISGKVTGLPDIEWMDNFESCSDYLTHKGFEKVINPTKLKPFDNLKTWENYMRVDIKELSTCDTIYFQENYWKSKGCAVEYYVAKSLGLKMIFEDDTWWKKLICKWNAIKIIF